MATTRGLIEPPKLRRESSKRASWMELFFDLVFVVAITNVTDILTHDQSARSFVWYAGIIVLAVWTWMNFVFYNQRFETDDLVHRGIKAVAMVAIAALAVIAPDAPRDAAREFALAYLAIRLTLLALYVRAWRHVPDARGATSVYLWGFGAAAFLWAASIPMSHARWTVWVVAGVVELATPLVAFRRFGEVAIEENHLEERMGQFTLIVLGEAVIGTVIGVREAPWSVAVAVVALSAAVLIIAIWWLTFDFAEVGVPTDRWASAYVYVHVPLFAAIATFATGLELALKHANDDRLSTAMLWIVFASLVIWLLSAIVVRTTSDPHRRATTTHLVAAAVLVCAVAALGGATPPVVMAAGALVVGADLAFKVTTIR